MSKEQSKEKIKVYDHSTAVEELITTSPNPCDQSARVFVPWIDNGPYVEIKDGRYLPTLYDYSPTEGLIYPR